MKNGYVCFYSGRRIEVRADDMFEARRLAEAAFKAPRSKRHMISVVLAEKGSSPVSNDGAVLPGA